MDLFGKSCPDYCRDTRIECIRRAIQSPPSLGLTAEKCRQLQPKTCKAACLVACRHDPFFKFPRRKIHSIQSSHSILKTRLGKACTAMCGNALKACRNMQSMRIDDAFTDLIAWNGKCIHFQHANCASIRYAVLQGNLICNLIDIFCAIFLQF
jgi:hypothetical protein